MSKLPAAKKSWSLRRKDQRESGEFESVDGEKLQRIPDELFNKSVCLPFPPSLSFFLSSSPLTPFHRFVSSVLFLVSLSLSFLTLGDVGLM
jgi:hypothetical protein